MKKANEVKYSAPKGVEGNLGEYIAPEKEVEFIETRSRWTGTGYKDEIYRIVGTDDAIIIHKNQANSYESGFYDVVEVKDGYFNEKRVYGDACRKLAQAYNVPVELVLAIKPNEEVVSKFAEMHFRYDERTYAYFDYELCMGINRRKNAIKELIGSEMADAVSLDSMGQKNSTRVAEFLLSRLIEC